MSSEFLKSFDDLLEQILVDYSNQDTTPDTTAGSITYIKAACLASMLWGLYRYQDYLAKQIFVDSADTDNLNHHGSIYGIARTTTDTDQTYATKILNFLRQPPAGGNKLDYETWALATSGVTGAGYTGILTVSNATVITPDDGLSPGSVSVTVMPNDETMLGTTGMYDLSTAAYTYIDSKRPVTANQLTVQPPTLVYAYITINVTAATGVTLDTITMVSDITAFVNTLNPGDPIYISKLQSICIQDGALNATVSSPVADLLPNKYTVYRLGSVTITQV
jgi:uncharacterized phage protein gp47/JayE